MGVSTNAVVQRFIQRSVATRFLDPLLAEVELALAARHRYRAAVR